MSKLVVTALVALTLVVPAAKSDTAPVSWAAPTPADQSHFAVTTGAKLTLGLSATTTLPDSVLHIAPAGRLPSGAAFNSSDGATATATFAWRPVAAGDYTVSFAASALGLPGTATTLTYSIHVKAKVVAVQYPESRTLTDDAIAHWTPVMRRAVVRSQPRVSARAVTTLDTGTPDDTQNIVLVLEERDVAKGQIWYRVRLPILPNNSTGWVQARSVGDLYTVHTHLYVDTKRFTATLKRNGRVVFRTIVGVGKSYWPTPRGEFYIRDKLTGFGNPAYGPVAFGTSARSAVLTDWPGGGFVGVHGTDEPQILPGRVSHGCIRMPNASILKLAQLMPVGTPLTVR
jgi:lipoprotein-anchoring transpeptidase ErfK/SrfK